MMSSEPGWASGRNRGLQATYRNTNSGDTEWELGIRDRPMQAILSQVCVYQIIVLYTLKISEFILYLNKAKITIE